jgi:hypothetical protein
MSPRRRTTTPGELWRGYRRPLRRDRALWLALGLCLAAVVIEFALSEPTTPLGWLAFGLIAVALVVLIVSLTGVFVGVFRGFADGWRSNRNRDAAAPAAPAPTSASAPSASGASGRSRAQQVVADEPSPTISIPPVPESVKNLAAAAQAKAPKQADVDRTARALGRAASAARRAYRKDD